MTVAELIEKLKEMPQDARVIVPGVDMEPDRFIDHVRLDGAYVEGPYVVITD